MMEVKFDYIGSFIRNFRQANGLSIQALADQSGVSRSMISQIESSSTSPTLAVLSKLAIAMQIELGDLVRPPEDAFELSKTEPNIPNLVSKPDSPFVCHLLKKHSKQSYSEIYFFYFRFTGKTSFAANIKGSKKSIWLESGSLILHLNTKKVLIEPKELVTFSASTPHRLESNKTKTLASGTFYVSY